MSHGGSRTFRRSIWLTRTVLFGSLLLAHWIVGVFDLLGVPAPGAVSPPGVAIAFRIMFVYTLTGVALFVFALVRWRLRIRRPEFLLSRIRGRDAFAAPLDPAWADLWVINLSLITLVPTIYLDDRSSMVAVLIRLGLVTASLLLGYLLTRSGWVVLYPDHVRISTGWTTYELPWNSVAPDGGVFVSGNTVTVCTTVPLNRHGSTWVQIRSRRLLTDRDFLAAAIAHYVAHPERRAGIGTPAGHAALVDALAVGHLADLPVHR